MSPVTFQSNAIASDGHYGIGDVIFPHHSWVHIDDLKVHRHTAEPDGEHIQV